MRGWIISARRKLDHSRGSRRDGRHVRVGQARQSEHAEDPFGLVDHVDPATTSSEAAPRVADLTGDPQVVAHGEVGEELEALERARYRAGPFVWVETDSIRGPLEPDAPGGRRHHPGNDVEERRLAGAVRSDEPGHLADTHVDVDIGQGPVSPERHGDLLDGEQGVARHAGNRSKPAPRLIWWRSSLVNAPSMPMSSSGAAPGSGSRRPARRLG